MAFLDPFPIRLELSNTESRPTDWCGNSKTRLESSFVRKTLRPFTVRVCFFQYHVPDTVCWSCHATVDRSKEEHIKKGALGTAGRGSIAPFVAPMNHGTHEP